MYQVRGRVWLELDTNCSLGHGRAELLEKVQKTGSLAEAARSMNMAYSHAWTELKSISQGAGGPVVTTTRGGKDGGGTVLTPLGETILERFQMEQAHLKGYLAERNRE